MRSVGKGKLRELRSFMEEKKIDAALFINSDVSPDIHIIYFSGFVQEPGGYSCNLLIDKKKRILFTTSLDFERAKEQTDAEEVLDIKSFGNSYGKAITSKLKKCKKIGVVKKNLSMKVFENLKKRIRCKFVDIEGFLSGLRAVKSRDEIKFLKKSTKIANSGISVIEETLNEISKGRKITEKKLAEIIEDRLKEKGAEDLAFKTICVSKKRTSFPHPYPSASNQIIKQGLGYVDFGAVYQGYHSDITVPFSIGRINEKQKKIATTTEQAYNLAIDSIEVGLPTWKLAEKIDNFIKSKGFELIHGLGHGLGLTIHDTPNISRKPTDKLQLKSWKEEEFKENMVFTIEPGIYTTAGGCRLENDILLTKKGTTILTNSRLIEA